MNSQTNKPQAELPPAVTKYLRAISRRLNLSREVKERVLSDLNTSICARSEQGESYEQIMAALGTPDKVAMELNEQIKEFAYRKSPWRFAFLLLAVLSLLYAGWALYLNFTARKMASLISGNIGIIGGADGPTSILISSRGITWGELITVILLFIIGLAGYFLLRRRPLKKQE